MIYHWRLFPSVKKGKNSLPPPPFQKKEKERKSKKGRVGYIMKETEKWKEEEEEGRGKNPI